MDVTPLSHDVPHDFQNNIRSLYYRDDAALLFHKHDSEFVVFHGAVLPCLHPKKREDDSCTHR